MASRPVALPRTPRVTSHAASASQSPDTSAIAASAVLVISTEPMIEFRL